MKIKIELTLDVSDDETSTATSISELAEEIEQAIKDGPEFFDHALQGNFDVRVTILQR